MRSEEGDPSEMARARERVLIAAARQQAAGEPGLEGLGAGGVRGDAAALLRGQLPGYEIEREIHRGGRGWCTWRCSGRRAGGWRSR